MSTLRFLFVLLLALNALALAAIQGWLGTTAPQGERERISNQLNPEHIQLTSTDKPANAPAPAAIPAPKPADPPPAPAEALAQTDAAPTPEAASPPPAPAPEAEAAPEPAPAAAPASAALPPPAMETVAEPAGVCVAWAGLASDEADALAERLSTAGATAERSRVEVPSSWWVRVPPQSSKEQAERRVQELRQLGVTDSYIVQDAGPSQFAVSLGLFKTENRAQLMLSQLRAKGVRNAGVEARTTSTYRIQATLDEDTRRAIEAALARLAANREDCKR